MWVTSIWGCWKGNEPCLDLTLIRYESTVQEFSLLCSSGVQKIIFHLPPVYETREIAWKCCGGLPDNWVHLLSAFSLARESLVVSGWWGSPLFADRLNIFAFVLLINLRIFILFLDADSGCQWTAWRFGNEIKEPLRRFVLTFDHCVRPQ